MENVASSDRNNTKSSISKPTLCYEQPRIYVMLCQIYCKIFFSKQKFICNMENQQKISSEGLL